MKRADACKIELTTFNSKVIFKAEMRETGGKQRHFLDKSEPAEEDIMFQWSLFKPKHFKVISYILLDTYLHIYTSNTGKDRGKTNMQQCATYNLNRNEQWFLYYWTY